MLGAKQHKKKNYLFFFSIQSLLDCYWAVYSSIYLFDGCWNLHIRKKDQRENCVSCCGPKCGVYQFERSFLVYTCHDSKVDNGYYLTSVVDVFYPCQRFHSFLPKVYTSYGAEGEWSKPDPANRLRSKAIKASFWEIKIAFLGAWVLEEGVEPSTDVKMEQSFNSTKL